VEQYADLKGRFDNRASRDEDLQKIAELEGFIQHKVGQCRLTVANPHCKRRELSA